MKTEKNLKFLAIPVGVILVFTAAVSWAHQPVDPPHQVHKMGDFKLESGEVIKDFFISYVTHGKLNEKKSNAILMTSSLGGDHHRIDFLIGPGKALDPEKYFIICTDAIGNGLSSSPSNSQSQPRMNFPRFTIRDMVESQHRLVTEKFGIQRLVAVAGASMGGFQGVQWAVSYPDFMDSVVALTGAARSSAWFIGVLYGRIHSLVSDPAWNGGNYRESLERGWRMFSIWSTLAGSSPEGMNHLFPNGKDIMAYLKSQEDATVKRKADANDQIYQSYACIEHNVGTTPGFQGDTVKALQSIKAKVVFLLGRNDTLVPAGPVREDAKYIRNVRVEEIPTLHGHMGASATYSQGDVDFCNRIVREFLDDVTLFGRKIQ